MKKLLFIIFMLGATVYAQYTVKGTMSPNTTNYSWIILYQLEGASQVYIKNAKIEDDSFILEFPEGAETGIYRLTYDLENSGFVDIIYNAENIALTFDPRKPEESLEFIASKENLIYNDFLKQTSYLQDRLDSLQYTYFRERNPENQQNTKDLYKKSYEEHQAVQVAFEANSEQTLANHFIKSNKRYYAPELLEEPQLYLNSEKAHYFDFLDFEDTVLQKSTLISEKVIDYVFYLNSSDDYEVQNGLFKSAINTIMKKVENNDLVKSEIIRMLLIAFGQTQNAVLASFLIEDYYKKLPGNYQDPELISEVSTLLKLAIGTAAPDFSWEENGETKKLHNQDGASIYVVVFWSTTCSHCLVEIPKLYDFITSNKNVKTIAIALEDEDTDFKEYSSKFKNWTNVLGLNKWENPIAKSYEVNATPTYFILNADKTIISKPEFFEDVKYFFESQN